MEIWIVLLIAAVAAAGYWALRGRNTARAAPRREAAAAVLGAPFTPPRAPLAEAVDLSDVVARIREPLQRALPANVRLAVDTSTRLPAARADRRLLELIIGHLSAHAVAAMPEGGTLTLRTHAAPTADVEAGEVDVDVVLEVEHTGAGVDPAVLPRLFEPLSGTGAGQGGFRLELATVQELVYQSHGRMRIENVQGGGTRIGVLLPPMPAAPRDPNALAARPGETVLVVEDEDAVRAIVRRTLQAAGYTILDASDPLVALEILERGEDNIDLLLSDIVMRSMRGTELVRRVRERWPLVRVLYMSGYGRNPETIAEVGRDGAVLVAKPFTSDELLGAVRQALNTLPGPPASPE